MRLVISEKQKALSLEKANGMNQQEISNYVNLLTQQISNNDPLGHGLAGKIQNVSLIPSYNFRETFLSAVRILIGKYKKLELI